MKNVVLTSVISILLAAAASAQETGSSDAARVTTVQTAAPRPDLYVDAGVDRDVVMPGKTYLKGYAGYARPSARRGGGAPAGTGPGITVAWSKASGPGAVTFAEEGKAETIATFSQTGVYVLKFSGQNSATNLSSTLTVRVADAPPKDRLDVVYTKFESLSRQRAVVETLLPLGDLEGLAQEENLSRAQYEFLPSAESIIEEVLPTAFRVKLFQCFLDAAVSEQIARMVAMKAATENADSIIGNLSITYNRARQTQITSEILEVISGANAIND